MLIADAPPHGLQSAGDGFPNGCPCGHEIMHVARSMAEAAITLYVIGCEPALAPHRDFFTALATITGGQYCALGGAAAITSVIVGAAREEIAVERLMRDVAAEVSSTAHLDEEARAGHVWAALKAKKATAAQLQTSAGAVLAATPAAVALSKMECLADVSRAYAPAAPRAAAAAPAAYDCVESAEVSMEQARRMVSKAVMRSKK